MPTEVPQQDVCQEEEVEMAQEEAEPPQMNQNQTKHSMNRELEQLMQELKAQNLLVLQCISLLDEICGVSENGTMESEEEMDVPSTETRPGRTLLGRRLVRRSGCLRLYAGNRGRLCVTHTQRRARRSETDTGVVLELIPLRNGSLCWSCPSCVLSSHLERPAATCRRGCRRSRRSRPLATTTKQMILIWATNRKQSAIVFASFETSLEWNSSMSSSEQAGPSSAVPSERPPQKKLQTRLTIAQPTPFERNLMDL
ncbi:uncharacterized protein LOC106537160 [Austrofundulus limnaeus]|uniref:Uncharacterized protein LOC106537160 n=1 Tax=Austrofundulus limnaeus TaxID=52670 RepID=A0A2I4DCL9_AUSLI|nr:PREDICTED: uncharacterized protein LOC106537160 [Austrofundulus limnaeus]